MPGHVPITGVWVGLNKQLAGPQSLPLFLFADLFKSIECTESAEQNLYGTSSEHLSTPCSVCNTQRMRYSMFSKIWVDDKQNHWFLYSSYLLTLQHHWLAMSCDYVPDEAIQTLDMWSLCGVIMYVLRWYPLGNWCRETTLATLYKKWHHAVISHSPTAVGVNEAPWTWGSRDVAGLFLVMGSYRPN